MNQKGIVHFLLLIAGLAVVVFVVITGFGPFKDKLLGVLYHKSDSQAADGSTNQIEFFISPKGSDSNDGSFNSPFKTLDRAKFMVRTVNQSGKRIQVWLRGGVYELSSPFVLEPQDSGYGGQYVVYQGYSGETVVISGGKQITGWTQEGDKWKAPSGGIQTRQLYVNGTRAVRAKSEGPPPGLQITTTSDFKTPGFSITDPNYQNFKNKTDMEVSLMSIWRQFKCPIAGITGNNISVAQPCWQASQWAWEGSKDPFYLIKPDRIENAYELLDQPGEWYLDKTSQTFYYKPKPGEDMAKAYVVAPVLENLVVGKGTPDNPLHHIAFQDIRFEYTTWNEPSSKGYVGGQAAMYLKYDSAGNQTGYGLTPAALTFDTARNISIVLNAFQRLGGAALSFGYASQNNVMYANHLANISGDGIILGDFDYYKNGPETPASSITKSNTIGSNYIHDIGLEYQGAAAIHVLYAQETQIGANEIHSVPYDGIALNTFPARDDESISKNNRIGNNLIYDHMKVGWDGGGIYVNSNQPGSVIHDNVLYNQHHRAGNIYIDDGGKNWTVINNVVYDILTPDLVEGAKDPTPNFGRAFSGKGCNHYIHDNYWQLKRNPEDFYLGEFKLNGESCIGTNNVGNNTAIASVSEAPQGIIDQAGIQSDYRKIKNINLNPPIVTLSAPAQVSKTSQTLAFNWNFTYGADGFERVNPYAIGAPDSEPLGSVYLSCTGQPSAPLYSGSCTIPNVIAADPTKKYELRMFAKDGVSVIAKSEPIEIISETAVSPSPAGGCSRDSECPANYSCQQVQCIQAPCNMVCLPDNNSPFPSSEISPGPSVVLKAGDTDSDGDVDIFDYNIVLTEFGKKNDPNTKADLDNDDDVDIFDFNILVTNFNR